jgi:hypothetical protein
MQFVISVLEILNRLKFCILAAICLLTGLVFSPLVFDISTREAHSQTNTGDMQALLEKLKQEISDLDREVYIEFVHPIVGDETRWTVPDIDDEGGYINRVISEIGTDYICFEERLGEILMQRCTPLSNIVSVSYIRTANEGG